MIRFYIPVFSTLLLFFILNSAFAIQPPTGLMTDLIEHTELVFQDGYPSSMSLADATKAIERIQVATVNSTNPSFGWIVNDAHHDVLQAAYQVLLADNPASLGKNEGNVWDSGKVNSDNSVSVHYSGKALQPDMVYYWKVKVWNNYGEESPYSEVKAFLTGSSLSADGRSAYPLQKTVSYPVKYKKTGDRSCLADFGKDAFGQLSLSLYGAIGTTDSVTVCMGELLDGNSVSRNPGGTLRFKEYKLKLLEGWNTYRIKNLPDKRNTGPQAVKMPDYVGEVLPFRYCELKNYTGEVSEKTFLREAVHYWFNDETSSFSCSDSVLNRVWDLCKYSIKATSFTGLYIDGDRERIPYEADALINQLGHYSVDREFSIARNTHEYLLLHPTWPTEWHLQSVQMAWFDYMYTGNKASIEKYYDVLAAKTLKSMADPATGLICVREDKQTPDFLQSVNMTNGKLRDIVDWPQKGILGLGKKEGGEVDGFIFKDVNTVVNAFHYRSLVVMQHLAETLGKTADAKQFALDAAKVKASFNKLFFDKKRGIYVDGIGTDHASQHSNFFALAFGLVPETKKSKVLEFIGSRGMACSVYGSQFLLDALYDAGDAEQGLQFLASTAERSWYNMLRVGSTITMEAWDNKYKPNTDWNHAWGAAPANLIPRKLFGIEPLESGFRKFQIKPQPDELSQAQISVPTVRGQVQVSWRKMTSGMEYNLTIPANSEADIYLPAQKSATITGWAKTGKIPFENGFYILKNVGSGTYQLQVQEK